ncbi:MAG TPA: metalloregulator ArsR/SmtB family transcription factor [Chthonomonadales bacterium]|nr:metalloregulator ArsR/SmtB family transcription factor [Chthonomonadales bacterium]
MAYHHFYISRNMVIEVNTLTCERLDFVAMFKALGDPTRLHIFEFLRSCCCPVAVGEDGEVRPVIGPTVGEVCCHVSGAGQINSTISHHLKELRIAGLINVERRGKNMICSIRQDAIEELIAYIGGKQTSRKECC